MEEESVVGTVEESVVGVVVVVLQVGNAYGITVDGRRVSTAVGSVDDEG
jgi:hypothetical protein